MMSEEELNRALRNHRPVVCDCRKTFSQGEYLYTCVSAVIHRYIPRQNKIVLEAELLCGNHVMTADPESLRYATPEEVLGRKVLHEEDTSHI